MRLRKVSLEITQRLHEMGQIVTGWDIESQPPSRDLSMAGGGGIPVAML